MKNLSNKKIRIIISGKTDGSMKLLGDFNDDKILENRKRFLRKNGIGFEKIVSADLNHGNKVEIVGKKEEGKFIEKTDGLITKEKNVLLTVTVADCLPIFIYNDFGVGILHGGWRGIAEGIVKNGIKRLKELTNSSSEEIFLKIGPAINNCCFEVGEEVSKSFEKFSDAIEIRENRRYLDLRKVVEKIALQEGLLENKIDIENECTSCLSDKYFSFRRDKPEKVEAMIAGIVMN